MRLVIYTNYYDFCNSWDNISYIEYESEEKFYCDFREWCKNEYTKDEWAWREGFLGLGLFPVHIDGDEQHGVLEIYTYEEWWERNVISIKGEKK